PARSSEELAAGSLVVVRVPDRGGAAPANSPLPRGMLFLKITPAAASDASVHRVTDSGSQLRLESEIVPPSSAEFASPDSRGPESSASECGAASLELVAGSRGAALESVQPEAIEQDDADVQRVLNTRSQSSGARRRFGALIWLIWGAGVLAVSYYFLMHR
ncbi:MAG TPA: hypothetical protein VFQ61_19780, partial [Polyangiaceae bacterium]|nr:hypothetical protein [Polyangiaceae bacterium]